MLCHPGNSAVSCWPRNALSRSPDAIGEVGIAIRSLLGMGDEWQSLPEVSSSQAVAASRRLGDALGIELSATLLYDFPCLDALTDYLHGLLLETTASEKLPKSSIWPDAVPLRTNDVAASMEVSERLAIDDVKRCPLDPEDLSLLQYPDPSLSLIHI